MATLLGLWSVQYPINFVANGDTVHQGFNKHIQEISRIYGLLNALDSGKVTTGDLTDALKSYVTTTTFNNHVNSTNPHPNLALSTLSGNLDVSRITGNWPLSRVSGTLSADNMNVEGLKTKLKSWVEGLNTGGISDSSLASRRGRVKFTNGFMIQWDTLPPFDDGHMETDYNYVFPYPFEVCCVGIWVTPWISPEADGTWIFSMGDHDPNWKDALDVTGAIMRDNSTSTLPRAGVTIVRHEVGKKIVAIGY